MHSMGLVDSAEGIGRWSEDEATAAFTRAIVALVEQLRPGSTQKRGRWTEMSIPTLYGYVKAMQNERKRRRGEGDEAGGSGAEDSERPAQAPRLGQ